MYYHGARYYIPWLARWSASDPMENKYAGMSPYNYSMNNPVMMNDPSGAEALPSGNGWSMNENGTINVTVSSQGGDDKGSEKKESSNSDEAYIRDEKGTAYFSTEGDFLGIINNDVSLEIHFIDIQKFKSISGSDKQYIDLDEAKNAINKINANADAKKRASLDSSFRSLSDAFIGKNSIESLKKIVSKSANLNNKHGKELAFYGDKTPSRELIFKELEVAPAKFRRDQGNDTLYDWSGTGFPMASTVLWNKVNNSGLNESMMYGLGHTHTQDYLNGGGSGRGEIVFGERYNLLNYGKPTKPGNTSLVDYEPQLMATKPLFIGSGAGITVFKPGNVNVFNIFPFSSFKK